MADLSVKLTVQIPGGPTIQSDRKIAVESYKKIDVSLPPNASNDSEFEFNFGPAADVNLFMIQSSLYSSEDSQISFTIGELADVSLGEPLLVTGKEIVKALALDPKVSFKNTYPAEKEVKDPETEEVTTVDLTEANTAKITILIGVAT